MRARRASNRGFTILEMALTLFSVGFLMSGLPRLLSQGNAVMAASPGSAPLEGTEFAMKSFLLKNYRLPCPAASVALGTENCTLDSGFVPWKTLGLARPATNLDGQPFAYAILRGSNDLGVATDDVYTPNFLDSDATNYYAAASTAPVKASKWNATSHTVGTDTPIINGLDFCAKLRRAAVGATVADRLRIRDWKTPSVASNAAWVLVDPGSADPAFNGYNRTALLAGADKLAFDSPGRLQAPDYDDKVVAGTLTQMFADLRCPTLLAATSAAAREADFANENWRVRKYLLDFRTYELDVRRQKKTQADNVVILATFDVVLNVALGVLDLGIALAGPAGAATIAASLISSVPAIALSAYGLEEAITSVIQKADEVVEGADRVTDSNTAVSDAVTFRNARRDALLLLDQRGWFQ